MPHIVVEHSANLAQRTDLEALAKTVHEAALATGVFPLGGLRTRMAAREIYVIADGDPDNAFAHMTLYMGHGRDQATKQQVGEELFRVLCEALAPVFDTSPLAISFEIRELDPVLNFKHNNLHARIEARRAKKEAAQ